MQLDALLQEYFGTSDIGAITFAGRQAGTERLLVDLGLETDRGRRFAMWLLLHTLGAAPDLDVVFEDRADRDAARAMMELMEAPLD